MNSIQADARIRLAGLADEPLFRTLAGDVPATRTLQILPYVTFWSMVFQDVIALNLERVRDPALRAIVQTHHDEDVGHHLWLAEDLRLIYGELPDVLAVFDARYLEVRAASYAFMAEVQWAQSDWDRVTLPIALEEGAKIFMPAFVGHFQRVGLGPHLHALGQRHVDVEAGHELHGVEMAERLRTMVLRDDARASAMAIIERVHTTFVQFAHILERVITTSSPEQEAKIARRLSELGLSSVATWEH